MRTYARACAHYIKIMHCIHNRLERFNFLEKKLSYDKLFFQPSSAEKKPMLSECVCIFIVFYQSLKFLRYFRLFLNVINQSFAINQYFYEKLYYVLQQKFMKMSRL